MASNDSVKTGARDAESEKALVSARDSLEKRADFGYGNTKVEDEFHTLGLLTKAERIEALHDALARIRPRHRRGPNPPDNISTGRSGGNLMYAFSWISRVYGPMYIKFCLVRKREEVDLLVLYSFHRSRPGYRA
jgi:hypothetical protein